MPASVDEASADAGALVALERGDPALWAVLKRAAAEGTDVVVPSSVVAQTWRGSPRQAQRARALASCVIAPLDPLAYAVGELCGRARTTDVCDAHVALVAAARADALYTSDPRDLRRLLALLDAHIAVIRC